ncbi:MAG: hypothetical protein RIB67_05665 [Miltoncostaeaceae bacterium]
MGGSPRPIAIDLDGSLTVADTGWLMFRRMLLRRPWHLPGAARSLLKGRADLKHHLWRTVPIEVSTLPWRNDLVAWLSARSQEGHALHLVTGAPHPLAELAAAAQPFPCTGHGSLPGHNLTSTRKAAHLVEAFGARGFDYVGNARADLAVWALAERAIVCGGDRRLLRRVRAVCARVGPLFP